MILQYNGVTLELVALDRVERVNVYSSDGMDLLYVHWIIGASCVFSPGGQPVGVAATILSPNTNRETVAGFAPPLSWTGTYTPPDTFFQEGNGDGITGYQATLTDVEVKTRLMIPRRKLIIGSLDDKGRLIVWLESPKTGLLCDMAGGPKPISVDVISVAGQGQTFGVHVQIETFQSPCTYQSDRALISHRWQMTHDHNEDNYLTRTIEGEAVFNLGVVASSIFQPDWIRGQLFHPIPLGFQRRLGPISLSPDGTTLKYTVSDVDTTILFDPGDSGATQMEIVENVAYSAPFRAMRTLHEGFGF